jgi:hypothetical protein
MNIQAILASLVLGSSSLAMAAPGVTVSAPAPASYGAPFGDSDNTPPSTMRSPPIMGPIGRTLPPVYPTVTLASGLSFAGQGRTFIPVGRRAGQFGELEITATGGRTFIKQVYVQFANGQEQVMRNLDRTLTGNERLTLDLDGGRRAIARIVVYGNTSRAGFRRNPGTFTVSAS